MTRSKVDQRFVGTLTDTPGSHAIVTAIIGLAHSLGMTVISEGVETARQHDALARLGSDACQGFYFARPMPATSLAALIEQQSDGSNPSLPSLIAAGHF